MLNLYLIISLFGLTLGSFYNVVGLRVPQNESIVAPRSACPKCKHRLKPYELIPVLSYIIQGGKCRQCKVGISPIYTLVELMTGLLFVAAPLIIGWSSELFVTWTLISLFMIIFVSDITYMIIPDKVLLVFMGIFLLERFFIPLDPWWNSLAGAAVGFFLLLVIAVISKGGMGGGDIKLFAVIGFVVGIKFVLLSFFLATLYGALFGIVGLLIGKLKRKNPIPFGPFIALGTLTAYFFGDQIIQRYFLLFAS